MANHAGSIAERSAAPRSILVIKPSSLGDVVHTLPAVALLKRHWPESRLRWLINPQWAPLLDGNRSVDELVIFPRDTFRGLLGSVRALRWVRRSRSRVRSDLVLDFQGLLRSALIARCWRNDQVVGLSDAREGARFFFDTTVPVDATTHAVERYLALVAALGVPIQQPLEWPLPAGEKPHGLDGAQRFVVLHPFARGSGKSLSESEVRDFCAGVSPLRVLLAGHHERAQEIADAGNNVLNLVNKTSLSELIWLMRQAAFVVSVDSGPMHIASALGRPLVSIHTWSDPRRVGPHRPDALVLQGGCLATVSELQQIRSGRAIETMQALGEFVREQLDQNFKETPR